MLQIPAWMGLAAWLAEIDRQRRIMRADREQYRRFDTTARQLTPARIRVSRDLHTLSRLVPRLDAARYPSSDLHGLDRVWSRAEIGTLLVEVTNRCTQLAMGRHQPKPKGPTFDPRLLPDHRLDHLIQTHRDLAIVDVLRAERLRRACSDAA